MRFGFLGRAQELKNVLLDPLHLESISFRVAPRGGQTLRASFNAGYFRRSRPRASERERSLAREAIEHPSPFGIFRDGGVVRQLIEIKSGLLRMHQVDGE